MEHFWAEWFGEGRGVGNPKRGYLSNPDLFTEWIQENEGKGLCSFSSVQPFSAYETPECIEKLFFDFDCKEDPSRAGRDAVAFRKRLREFYGVEALQVFSGNKGYHLYVFLEKPIGYKIGKHHLKLIYDRIQRMILGQHKYETLDSSVIGDISQLARIPYTHHEKTGRLCEPLDFNGDLGYYRTYGLSFQMCRNAVHSTFNEILERAKPKPRKNTGKFKKRLRPCIEDALSRSYLSHDMRVAVVAELNADGWSIERIIEAFMGNTDFKRRETEYQVKHVVRGGYSPFRCSSLQEMGECLEEKCGIYRARKGVKAPPITGWGVQWRMK